MRIRVLLPLVALGLLAVVAVLLPVCEAIAVSRTQQLALQRSGTMDQIVQRAETALADGSVEQLARYLERIRTTYGEAAVVVDASGDVVAATGGLEEEAAAPQGEAGAALRAALRALPQWSIPTVRPWSDDAAYAAEPVSAGAGAASGAVLLRVGLGQARADVAGSWLLAALVAAALLAALVAASLRWTSWVLRPVHALDDAATAIAQQRRPLATTTTGPPELRRLTASFGRMAASVEHTIEQQRAFVADASHQLRNPLAAIRLRVDAAPVEPGDDDWREPVDRDLDRLERIVERMLVLAEAEHRANADPRDGDDGQEPVVVHRVSARDLVDAVEAEGRVRVEASGETQVAVRCRRGDLDEIVGILVDNAGKYAGAGATATVALRPDGDRALLEVRDDGPGLPDAELGQVGTRFWRSSAHQGLPGTGLGLAIVRELARANGGAVRIDRAPEGGLRVAVALRGGA